MNGPRSVNTRSLAWLIGATWRLVRPYGITKLIKLLLVVIGQIIAQSALIFAAVLFIQVLGDPNGLSNSLVGGAANKIFGSMDTHGPLIQVGLLSITIILIAAIIAPLLEYRRGRIAHQIGCWLRDKMVATALSRDYHFYMDKQPSSLVKNVVQDVMIFTQQVLLPIIEIVARSGFVLILGLLLVFISPIAVLVASVFAVLYVAGILRLFSASTDRVSDGVKLATQDTYGAVTEIFSGVKTITSQGLESYFRARAHEPSARLAVFVPKALLLAALPRYILEGAILIGFVGWSLAMVYHQGQSVNDIAPKLAVTALVMYRIMPALQIIVSQAVTASTMRHSVEEILVHLEPITAASQPFIENVTVTKPRFDNSIRLKSVSYQYPSSSDLGSASGVQNLNLIIGRGQQIGIVGATGAGKSTLVDLIGGLIQPAEGQILIDEVPLKLVDKSAWRSQISYLPQDLFLINASIIDNIALGQSHEHIDIERVRRSAELAQVREFIEEELPNGYSTIVGERGARLSGGQRQRLGLARAFYREPALLVLDEATSALDAETERGVFKALRQLQSRPGVVIITHRLSLTRDCDYIYVISSGSIVASGTFQDLSAEGGDFKRQLDAGTVSDDNVSIT